MAKVYPYHTKSEEDGSQHRNVYHDHDNCSDGKRIKAKNKETGTDGRPRCKECISLG